MSLGGFLMATIVIHRTTLVASGIQRLLYIDTNIFFTSIELNELSLFHTTKNLNHKL